MPFYDLRCENCNIESNVMASMSDKAENRIPCPECGSLDMKTVYKSAPAYIKNSGDAMPACPSRTAACGSSGCRFAG